MPVRTWYDEGRGLYCAMMSDGTCREVSKEMVEYVIRIEPKLDAIRDQVKRRRWQFAGR